GGAQDWQVPREGLEPPTPCSSDRRYYQTELPWHGTGTRISGRCSGATGSRTLICGVQSRCLPVRRRPQLSRAPYLPDGGPGRTRTAYLSTAAAALSLLSYRRRGASRTCTR